MSHSRSLLSLPLFALLFTTAGSASAAIAPLDDADVDKFVAIQRDLLSDPERAVALCELDFSPDEESPDPEGAQIGRRIDAHPITGTLVRKHGMTGQRFAQVAVQIVAQAMALGIAEHLDESAKSGGKPGSNRSDLLARSAEARLFVARQTELTEVLGKAAALCGNGDDAGDEGDESEAPEPPEE